MSELVSYILIDFNKLTRRHFTIAIDEEFVSQLKLIEANMKRMQALLVSYEEQKSDLKPEEKNDRHFVIQLLREALKLLRHDYEQ